MSLPIWSHLLSRGSASRGVGDLLESGLLVENGLLILSFCYGLLVENGLLMYHPHLDTDI